MIGSAAFVCILLLSPSHMMAKAEGCVCHTYHFFRPFGFHEHSQTGCRLILDTVLFPSRINYQPVISVACASYASMPRLILGDQ